MANRGTSFINVNPGLKRLKKFEKELGKEPMRKGISEAINKTLIRGRGKVIAVVSGTHNIPAKELGKIRAIKSRYPKLEGGITAPTNPLPLSMFKPKYEEGAGTFFNVLKSKGKIGYAIMFPGNPNVYGRGFYKPKPTFGFERKRSPRNKSVSNKKVQERKERKPGTNPLTRMVTTSVWGAINGTENKKKIEDYLELNLKTEIKRELQKRIDEGIK